MKIYEDNFIDAQEKKNSYPNTFDAPSEDDLKNIKVGNFVKICNGYERFWVKVQLMQDDKIIGIIESHLVSDKPYGYGDKIKFSKNNIYDIED